MVLGAATLDDPPVVERVGGNLPVNASATVPADISAHNSPTLARNPRDGDDLAIAARIDAPRFSCGLHVSHDAGATWRQTPVPAPAGEEPKCYAPDVAYGADGTLYLSFVTLAGRGNVPNAAWLATSADSGRTLSTPRRILGPRSFQVRLVADPRRARSLYLTWLAADDVGLFRFTRPGNPLLFKRSDDAGTTWSAPVRLNLASRRRALAASLAAGAGDDLFAVYLDLGGDRLDYEGGHEGRGGPPYDGPWTLVLSRSLDGGGTWAEAVIEDELVPFERILAFLPPFPSVAVDRDRRRLYAAFHDASLGDADVWLWSSGDGGATFRRVRVNDTRRGDGTAQYLPRVDVAPDGRVDVVYYDRRGDPSNRFNEVSLQSSFDGGRTFTERVELTERPFDSRVGFGAPRGMPDLGSRLALLSTEPAALAVWADTRAGTQASGKQDLARAAVAVSAGSPLAGWARWALIVAGGALALGGALAVATGRRGAP